MVNEDELLDLMAVASWLYYEKQMTHDEIAHELSMNRVGVTRLLQKARQQGIVKFTITRALPHHYELSKEIQQKYHLAHVVIVQSGGDEKSTMNALGKAGAEFLDQQLFDGCRLGMAWSKTVSSIGNYLHQIRKFNHLTIHELAGTYLMDGVSYGITWKVSELLQAPLISMPVPVIVSNAEAREAILSEANIQKALATVSDVDIALVGIGSIQEAGTIIQTGFMKEEERLQLLQKGIAGEILMRFFDENGEHVPTVLDNRVIGIQWLQLVNVPNVVAMAFGKEKIAAIQAAIKGKVIKTLITDSDTANLLV